MGYVKSTSCCAATFPSIHINLGKLPSPNFEGAGSRRLLRRGGQPRARPHSCNAVLADRPRTHKYQLAPPSARLQEQGMTPLLPPRGRSPHHFSVEFFEKQSSPHQNWKIGMGIPSPRFGAGIGNARHHPVQKFAITTITSPSLIERVIAGRPKARGADDVRRLVQIWL